MRGASDIQDYLRLLAKHGALIDEAYRSRTVRNEGSILPAISELQAARIFITTGEGECRLETGIKKLLDRFTQRQRSFATGQNIAAEIDSLRQSVSAYEAAIFSGSADERDNLLDDIHMGIGSIHDTVSSDLTRFQQATEINFSTSVTPRQKAQQNEYYLKKAQELEVTLRSLTDEGMENVFENEVLLDIKMLFQREVERHIGEWSDRLLRTIDILQKYLYRHREVTEATKRLRSFGSFLKKNSMRPVEDLLALDTTSDDLALFRQVDSKGVKPYPDFITPAGKANLLPVIQRMEPMEARVITERTSGRRAKDGDVVEIEEILSPEEEALSVFLDRVRTSARYVSAEEVAREIGSIEITDLLEEILNWSTSGEEIDFSLRSILSDGLRQREANVVVRDIEACLTV